ncbi:hypothetical protein Hanom_Chr07g00631731 [Helianthus anomalus]
MFELLTMTRTRCLDPNHNGNATSTVLHFHKNSNVILGVEINDRNKAAHRCFIGVKITQYGSLPELVTGAPTTEISSRLPLLPSLWSRRRIHRSSSLFSLSHRCRHRRPPPRIMADTFVYGMTFWKSHFSLSHTPSLPNTILELMTFQKANKLISCFKKLSQTCPLSL